MKKVLIGLTLCFLAAGCDFLSTRPDLDKRIGYGPVNHWWMDDMRWVDAMAEEGIGVAHIEFLGRRSLGRYENPDPLFSHYRRLVQLTEMYGIQLFVSIANDNKGLGKYGDDRRGLDQFEPQLRRAADFVLKHSPKGTWIQPVCEQRSAAGARLEAYVAQRWPKEHLVSNGNRGQPSGPAPWAGQFAFHQASSTTPWPQGAILVSDHSGILREFFGGDWMGDARADPEKVEGWARRGLEAGSIVVLYAWGQRTVDREALRALVRAAR